MYVPILLVFALVFYLVVCWRKTGKRDHAPLLPGPESDSFLTGEANPPPYGLPLTEIRLGNMHTIVASPSDAAAMAWTKQYGGIVKLNGVLGVSRHVLLISDPAALGRIFSSTSGQWEVSSRNLASFRSLFGPGVAAVEGADHIRQRRVISQALTLAEVRGMTDIVQATSRNVRMHCRFKL